MKRHLLNLGALSSIQLANALLPVLVFPWLLNVLGAGPFARIAVTEAATFFALAVVLYSFEVEGVARVATLRLDTDRERIGEVHSAILATRLLLLGACLALLALASFLLAPATSLLLLCWMLVPLAHALQSSWLFQALERNLALAVCVVGSRLVCLGALYGLVQGPQHLHRVPLIIGGAYVAGALAALLYLVLALGIGLRPVRWPAMRTLLADGKEIFFGNLSVALFRESNVLILGALGSASGVAVYAVAEKLIKCFQAMARPLNQLLFPRVLRALGQCSDPERGAFRIIWRYTVPQWLALAAAGSALALAYVVMRARFPHAYVHPLEAEIIVLLAIMAPATLFGVANFMFGTAGLNYLNRRAYFARAIFLTGLCSVALCGLLGWWWAERGAALAFLFSEALLFLLIARAYRRRVP